MENYYSVTLCRRGYCSAFNTIYKKDSLSRVFVLSDGDDLERSLFFKRLAHSLRGYSISLFNPFYDEAADGIFIKSLNAYILSDGGYNRISPALAGEWENYISISKPKKYPSALRREVLALKALENEHYKKACKHLGGAGDAKEKIHSEISRELDDEKLINFLKRFLPRTFRSAEQKGHGAVRLISSPAPLGIHTHWSTVFDNYETVISIQDETGFVSAVILGIIKDYAQNEGLPFFMSPSYFSDAIPQLLLFPTVGTAIVSEDSAHPLPFEPAQRINASRFTGNTGSEKIAVFSEIEKRMLDSCVMSLFEGRDCRSKYNGLIKEYSDFETAEKAADELLEKILN